MRAEISVNTWLRWLYVSAAVRKSLFKLCSELVMVETGGTNVGASCYSTEVGRKTAIETSQSCVIP